MVGPDDPANCVQQDECITTPIYVDQVVPLPDPLPERVEWELPIRSRRS